MHKYVVHYCDPETGEGLQMPFSSLIQACRFAKNESNGLWEKAYVDVIEDGQPLTLAMFENGRIYREPRAVYGVQNPYPLY